MSSIIMCNFKHWKKSEVFHLVTFTEENFNRYLYFLCSEFMKYQIIKRHWN